MIYLLLAAARMPMALRMIAMQGIAGEIEEGSSDYYLKGYGCLQQQEDSAYREKGRPSVMLPQE